MKTLVSQLLDDPTHLAPLFPMPSSACTDPKASIFTCASLAVSHELAHKQ